MKLLLVLSCLQFVAWVAPTQSCYVNNKLLICAVHDNHVTINETSTRLLPITLSDACEPGSLSLSIMGPKLKVIGDEELKFISPCVAHLDIVAPMLQTLDLTFLTWLQSLHLTAVSPELLYRGSNFPADGAETLPQMIGNLESITIRKLETNIRVAREVCEHCHGNGTSSCETNICQCKPEWRGRDCSIPKDMCNCWAYEFCERDAGGQPKCTESFHLSTILQPESECRISSDCPAGLVCHMFGHCACPSGMTFNDDTLTECTTNPVFCEVWEECDIVSSDLACVTPLLGDGSPANYSQCTCADNSKIKHDVSGVCLPPPPKVGWLAAILSQVDMMMVLYLGVGAAAALLLLITVCILLTKRRNRREMKKEEEKVVHMERNKSEQPSTVSTKSARHAVVEERVIPQTIRHSERFPPKSRDNLERNSEHSQQQRKEDHKRMVTGDPSKSAVVLYDQARKSSAPRPTQVFRFGENTNSLEQENNYLRSVLNVAGNTSPPNQPTHDSVQRQASQPNASPQPENYYKSIAAHASPSLRENMMLRELVTQLVQNSARQEGEQEAEIRRLMAAPPGFGLQTLNQDESVAPHDLSQPDRRGTCETCRSYQLDYRRRKRRRRESSESSESDDDDADYIPRKRQHKDKYGYMSSHSERRANLRRGLRRPHAIRVTQGANYDQEIDLPTSVIDERFKETLTPRAITLRDDDPEMEMTSELSRILSGRHHKVKKQVMVITKKCCSPHHSKRAVIEVFSEKVARKCSREYGVNVSLNGQLALKYENNTTSKGQQTTMNNSGENSYKANEKSHDSALGANRWTKLPPEQENELSTSSRDERSIRSDNGNSVATASLDGSPEELYTMN